MLPTTLNETYFFSVEELRMKAQIQEKESPHTQTYRKVSVI